MIQYTRDGKPFIAAADLSAEVHTRLLVIFENEVDASRGTGKSAIEVGANAAERARANAIVRGTDREAAEVIFNTATELYAAIITGGPR